MKKILALACIVYVAGIAAAAGPSANSGTGSGVTVSGNVTLTAPHSLQVERDASKVVVWLAPVQAFQPASARSEPRHYRLVQQNKRFDPGLLVVPVGSVVDFPNLDPWFHNVFSLYRGKRFDLGLYQAGSVRSVSFDRPGPSYLFCNIHPEMTGVVLAVSSELFAVTDKNGRFSISGVPGGRYELHVWHENAALNSLQNAERTVEVGETNVTLQGISILLNQHGGTGHKNKYGQEYDPDTLKTDY